MKDLRIKLKLYASLLMILAPVAVIFIKDDISYYRYESLSIFLTFWLFFGERKYVGYLKTWFRFHFLGKYRKGLSPQAYLLFKNRIKELRLKKEAFYEQKLIQQILEASGEEYNKVRLTGKNKNKVRIKGRIKFEANPEKNKKYSNYKRTVLA
jgi:hypothetical protein